MGTEWWLLAIHPWHKVSSMKVYPGQTNDKTREALSLLGMDGMWRCPNWSFVRSYAAKGGRLFRVCASYAGNSASDFCMIDGRVCHQDDIYIMVSSLFESLYEKWDSYFSQSLVLLLPLHLLNKLLHSRFNLPGELSWRVQIPIPLTWTLRSGVHQLLPLLSECYSLALVKPQKMHAYLLSGVMQFSMTGKFMASSRPFLSFCVCHLPPPIFLS